MVNTTADWRTRSGGSSPVRSSSGRERTAAGRKSGIAAASTFSIRFGWFRDEGGRGRRENLVTLSAPFWEELKSHPIPVDADVVRVLANNPGCLNLYTWLTWRCFQTKGAERIPLFGPYGLAAQLGVQEYARERKFRERIRGWLKLVHLYWPECPAEVSRRGDNLELAHSSAIRTRTERLA